MKREKPQQNVWFEGEPEYIDFQTIVVIDDQPTKQQDWNYCLRCSSFVPEGHNCAKERQAA